MAARSHWFERPQHNLTLGGPPENRTVTQLVTPQLRCTNWPRTRQFYEDGLGFQVQWMHQFEPHLPVFAEVARGPLSLFLTEHKGDCEVGGAAYIIVDDVDAYFAELRARGIVVREPPEDSPWETREMLVVDPDGNRLRFANQKQ